MPTKSEMLKQIFSQMGVIIKTMEGAKAYIEQIRQAGVSRDEAELTISTENLQRAFYEIGELAASNQGMLKALGIEGPNEYKKLVSALKGETKQTFSTRVAQLEQALGETKVLLEQQEMLMSAQLNLVREVVGEMKLEINV
ncbi:hypothetical protein [Vibrio mediterranei]|uniref:hypothetical protein n=1 Tax=Vibrio mediterranei TaxID=689 RepID=UPI0040679894